MCINNFFSGLFVCFIAATSFAGGPRDFEIPKAPPADLLKETSVLSLQTEQSVQSVNPPATMFLSVLGGIMKPSFLAVESKGHTVDYDFGDLQLPLLTAQFTHYVFNNKWGKWGWLASLSYSYSEFNGAQATALHLLPANVSIAYRGEWKDTQTVVPYLALGPSLWSYFQRGLDEYNTSGSSWLASGTLGVAFNLNRLKLLDSRNDTEVVLQYQRNIGPSNNSVDFNGDTLELGGTLAL